VSILQPAVPLQGGGEPLEAILVREGRLMSLHGLLLKQGLPDHLLDSLLEWLAGMKLIAETEQKVPLLWLLVVRLLVRTSRPDKVSIFCQHLSAAGEERGWDILGVIGLRKQLQPSARLRVLARVSAALLLVQFPKSGDQVRPRTSADSPGAVQNLSTSSM